MRICIDIDGTICKLRKPHENYQDLEPIELAAEKIRQLKNHGHYIILCTARHMKTCGGNVGKVIALQGFTLIKWLEQHNFEYDELLFGKPYADVYIDDKALEFGGSWSETYNKLNALNSKNNKENL